MIRLVYFDHVFATFNCAMRTWARLLQTHATEAESPSGFIYGDCILGQGVYIHFSAMPGLISPPILRVAIISGGPGGLSSAIALSKLDNIEVAIYEKAKELREIGAGINTW